MKLSEYERLVLSNQFKIMTSLFPEEKKYLEIKMEILEEGYEIHYGELADSFCEPMSEKDSRKVLDILDMYRALAFSIEELAKSKKSKYYMKKVFFTVFDGNNETKEMVYVKFFIHKMGRFEELKHPGEYPDYNTHYPTLDQYTEMLIKWKNIGDNCFELNENQITELLEHAVSGSLIEK